MRTMLLALVAIVTSFAGQARAENLAVRNAIEGFVKPGYFEFGAVANRLTGEMEALCADQSPDRLAAVQSTFLTLVTAWSEIEIVRFGPVTQENRLERILFWPDRKSIGLKQVQAALAEKDATAADPATLKGKSVAMQGLGALEFVLFGTGSESLNAPGDPYRCTYGKAIAHNLEDIAASIVKGWEDPNGIARQWANPGADNPLYRSDDEAMTELFGILVHGLEMVRDVRLNGFLGDDPSGDKPKQAIYWRSGGTTVSIRANLHAFRILFEMSGIAGLLPAESSWMAQSATFEFDNAGHMLDVASGPIAETLTDEKKRGALNVVRLITSHLSEIFGVSIASELGLSAGFSSLDGD